MQPRQSKGGIPLGFASTDSQISKKCKDGLREENLGHKYYDSLVFKLLPTNMVYYDYMVKVIKVKCLLYCGSDNSQILTFW